MNRTKFNAMLAVVAVGVLAMLGAGWLRADPALGRLAHNSTVTGLVAPVSPCMDWTTAVATGGADDVDANPISNFSGVTGSGGDLVTNASTRRVIQLNAVGGTTLLLRVKYPTATTAGTSITLAVGGKGSNDQWDRLLLATGARSLTITAKSTDCGDGTWKWTDVDARTMGFDMKGARNITVGVEATGFGSTAVVEAKGI